MWATLIHSFTPVELFPFAWAKILHMSLQSALVLVRTACPWASWVDFMLSYACSSMYWARRIFYLWSMTFGPGMPWLLWVPDAIVLFSAILFDLGLLNAVEWSQRIPKKKRSKAPLSNEQHARLYKQFVDGPLFEDEKDEPSTPMDGRLSPTLSSSPFTSDDDNSVSADEMAQLLKDARAHDETVDDTYVIPNRPCTRQMRRLKLAQQNTSNASSSRSTPRGHHFRSALYSPSSAATGMVDSLLASPTRRR